MAKLKWFSGGKERREEAVNDLNTLNERLNETTEIELKKVIQHFLVELENQQEPVPLILSRFNIEVSNCLLKHSIELLVENKELVKSISELSQIRYGY